MSQNLMRHTLSVDGLSNAPDVEALEKELDAVPGLEEVDVDAPSGDVCITVEGDVAVGDAKWVIDHLGYTLA